VDGRASLEADDGWETRDGPGMTRSEREELLLTELEVYVSAEDDE
jgi:hypothetical protein